MRLFAGTTWMLLLLSSNVVFAEEPKFIMGTMKSTSFPGKSYSEYCTPQDIKKISEGQIVLVIGKSTCSPKYLSPKEFYEISWRGESYFIETEEILLKESDKERIETLSTEEWDDVKKQGVYASGLVRQNELEKVLAAIEAAKPKGLAIVDWAVVDESEYTKGTGLRIQPYNPTKKTIKYIWFTVQGYNPVDDPIGAPVTVKAIGPLEPDSSGSYRFEYTWMTDLVDTAKFRQIRVQYMDGTQKIISKPGDIILSDEESDIFND